MRGFKTLVLLLATIVIAQMDDHVQNLMHCRLRDLNGCPGRGTASGKNWLAGKCRECETMVEKNQRQWKCTHCEYTWYELLAKPCPRHKRHQGRRDIESSTMVPQHSDELTECMLLRQLQDAIRAYCGFVGSQPPPDVVDLDDNADEATRELATRDVLWKA